MALCVGDKKEMKAKFRQSGITLMEMTVVTAVAVLLAVFGLPAIRTFTNSFETQGSTKVMISAGLASARAIAAREQRYAGIRFQNEYTEDDKGCQYMIFIVHDFDKTGLANGFRAVEGVEPIKLPDTVGVMDLRVRIDYKTSHYGAENADDRPIDSDSLIDNPKELRDTAAFSIIFSPAGKLVIHNVRVRNRDGYYQPDRNNSLKDSRDSIFNGYENIRDYGIGMFEQDDYAERGFGAEPSRNRFVIYDRTVFEKVDEKKRWSDYLKDLDFIYINPYTGRMISAD